MGFLAIVNAYTMRICLNVAITEMVLKNRTKVDDDSQNAYCSYDDEEKKDNNGGGEYEWSESLQGVILGAFFWGYVLTHVPGGILSEKFGGKYTLGLGILSTAIFTIITPVTIHAGEWIDLRV